MTAVVVVTAELYAGPRNPIPMGSLGEAFRRLAAVQREIARRYFALRNPSGYNEAGVDVFAQEWDNLVILDACRRDAFERVVSLPGDLGARVSRGSATREFVAANFANRRLADTVYVSANLWFPKLADDLAAAVHRFVPVPEEGNPAVVRPAAVTERAREIDAEYPNKRLVVHYTQPHFPYLGETGRTYLDVPDTPNLETAIRRSDADVTPAVVRRAYRENLDLVADSVSTLLATLSGRTVVTADHGELLGERLLPPLPGRQYGHPAGVYVSPLVTVPWLVVDAGDRKRVVDAEADDAGDVDADVDRRLRDLGYRV